CTSLPSGNFFTTAVGDFNGDGKLDLAFNSAQADGPVAVVLGNGDGTFGTAQTFAVNGEGVAIAVADLNADGKSDLVVTNAVGNSVLIYLGNGDGTFRAPLSFAAGANPYAVTVADMNGDGRVDLVIGDGGYELAPVSVLLGNGDGTFQDYTPYGGIGAVSAV